MGEALSMQELEAAHCWEAGDRVPGRPEMTEFRRGLRLHQARWRESHGHPIGSQPMRPVEGKPSRRVGSRLALEYALDTGANFLTPQALDAARARTSAKEPRQTFDKQGLWADLLSSTAMTINLFGDLAADLTLADRAVHTWWPDAPGRVSAVRFAHSPGRLDLSYIGSLVTFDVAFELDLGDGTKGIVAVGVSYHERIQREVPKPIRLPRYLEVTETSGVFGPDAVAAVNGTVLTVTWLQHLLMLSMLQHVSGQWGWGRFVLLQPGGNTDFVEAGERYAGLVTDSSTFASATVESVLDAGALRASTATALRERYLPG